MHPKGRMFYAYEVKSKILLAREGPVDANTELKLLVLKSWLIWQLVRDRTCARKGACSIPSQLPDSTPNVLGPINQKKMFMGKGALPG